MTLLTKFVLFFVFCDGLQAGSISVAALMFPKQAAGTAFVGAYGAERGTRPSAAEAPPAAGTVSAPPSTQLNDGSEEGPETEYIDSD